LQIPAAKFVHFPASSCSSQ